MPMAWGRVMREAQWGLRTIRATLMASVCLGAVSAHAVDGTWLPAPATSDWNTGTNWTSSPAVPDGTATFNTSNQTTITFSSSSTFVQTIQFASFGSSFTFSLPNGTLNITGDGIRIASQAFTATPTFNQSLDGSLRFFGSATASSANAGGMSVGTNINNNDTGTTFFAQSSTAGRAFIVNVNNPFGAGTTFGDQSTAGFATIENFTSAVGGGTTFRDQATAGSASIFNFSVGITTFRGQSNAGNARIDNDSSGATFFLQQSSAGSATIINEIAVLDPSPGITLFRDTSTAANATIINKFGGATGFRDMSTAGSATITNSSDSAGRISRLEFFDNSTAGNATIVNDQFGQTFFHDQSTAGTATITNQNGGATFCDSICDAPAIVSATFINNAGGATYFRGQGTAGFARLIANAGGVVDMSSLTTTGMTAGSIEGAGTFFLGSKQLTVGLNNFSTEVSGRILDGGLSGGTGGSLVKVGSGTLILSGANSYTGATTLNEGALIVNGSIAASSGLNVNAGTLLGGTGTLPTTRINAGGALSPGNSIGTIAVAGNLSFAPGSFYLVEVSPTTSDRTVVNGTASLRGTVLSSFQIAGGFQKSYTILSAAGGVSGAFDALATTGLPSFVTANLGYTPNLVTLNLTLRLALLPGLSGNQANVAAGIDSGFNAGNPITGGFATLLALPSPSLPGALTQISGEAATGAQQGAFRISDQFLGLMLDPFVDGRSGIGGADRPALGFAPEREALPDDIALAYAKVLKAPPMKEPSFEQRWTAWGGGFGGSSRVSGDPAVTGSHDLSASTAGYAGGLDYHLSRESVVGFALAGGGTNWGLAQALGGGKSDAFQAGVYGATRSGPAYVAAAFDFTNHWMSTDRFAFAGDHLIASFQAQSLGARVESGYRFGVPLGGVTPYAAIQAQSFRTPSYSESDTNGGGFGLAFNGRTATDTRSELGARFDRLLAFNPTAVLALRARLAWAHDWVSDPTLAAVFQTLPGGSFIVNGATPAKNSALASAGAELRLANGVTLLGKFDGEFASHSSTYAGTGTVRYRW
jgi:autotransporter-associated beta strand protein